MAKQISQKEWLKKKQQIKEAIARVDIPEEFSPEEKAKRVERAKVDFFYFCDTYLPHYFGEDKTPDVHYEWINEVERTDKRVIPIAAPRGHAKSTRITFGWPLWQVLKGTEHIIPIISDTEYQAIDHTMKIKLELEDNKRIREDFGEIAVDGGDGDFIANYSCRVLAMGAGQKIRGLKHQQHRPRIIICDDLENDKDVLSEKMREKLWKWFMAALIPALHPKQSRIFIVGTILHYDSLLNNLIKKFDGKIYKALENGKSLWESRFSVETLESMRETMGNTLFEQEMNNNPVDEGSREFREDDLQVYTSISEKVKYFKTYTDPAVGRNKKSDYSASITGALGESGTIYIEACNIEKQPIKKTMDYIFKNAEEYSLAESAIETFAFQEVLKQWIEENSKRDNKYIPVIGHTPKGSKESRIKSLVPLIQNGTIKFKGARHFKEVKGYSNGIQVLLEQILQFPKGKNDDGPDCLASLVERMKSKKGKYGSSAKESFINKFSNFSFYK